MKKLNDVGGYYNRLILGFMWKFKENNSNGLVLGKV